MVRAPLITAAVDDALQALGLPTAWYRPERPEGVVALLLHGGSFNNGSLADAAGMGRALAEAGVLSLAIGYPLAPAHPFPQALDAAFAVLQLLWTRRKQLAGRPARLIVAGMGAGGNLAAALALRARDEGQPELSAQLLLAPALDPMMATASLREAKAGMCDCQFGQGWKDYLGSAADHPYAAPLLASRLAGVAPALLMAAKDEPLRDDTALYFDRLLAAGVPAKHHALPADGGWRTRAQARLDGSEPSPLVAWAPVTALTRAFLQSKAGP